MSGGSSLRGSAARWCGHWRGTRSRTTACGAFMPGDENDPVNKSLFSAFTQALAGLGWTDGRNVRIDLRSTGDDINWMRALAQELVGLQPDIILAGGTPATAAVQRETRTVPIVFASVTDPLASGLVVGVMSRPPSPLTMLFSRHTSFPSGLRLAFPRGIG
jgi:ABC transporter substrate binding protein